MSAADSPCAESGEAMTSDPYAMPKIPEQSSLGRIARGVDVGDPCWDDLPAASLRAASAGLSPDVYEGAPPAVDPGCRPDVAGACPCSPQAAQREETAAPPDLRDSIPAWVDPERVKRGQKVYQNNCYDFMRSFEVALLWGCRIDRFADVLVRSGYTSSPRVAFRRFRDTARHVAIWCSDDRLSAALARTEAAGETKSIALKSIAQVRAAHSLARRRVRAAGSCNVGLPVSQYDLALTLMAFSLIALDGVVNDCEVSLSDEEIDDYLHLWRTLGYLHGIQDEFNPCNDRADALEILKDINELFFFADTFRRQSDAAKSLTLRVFEGFSLWGTGTGGAILSANFLRPLQKKPFIPLNSITWMPLGQALTCSTGSSWKTAVQRRRIHVACALNASMMSLLQQQPWLRRLIQLRYFRLLKWGLVEGNIPLNRAERGLFLSTRVHEAIITVLAVLLVPFGFGRRTSPVADDDAAGSETALARAGISEDQRCQLMKVWRSQYNQNFRYTGLRQPLTKLSFGALLRRVAFTAGLSGFLLVVSLAALRRRRLRLQSLRRLSSRAALQ
eukprot:TRINITY_DN34740_c0_g2_i1.p1 TRINITY_DN34740_c0_g2~~TRINITY_DN34740_c0_g2_i1.p1  ORF type:complete len:560 (+),score=110.77 TRINITY_DN34740_c0_g2_i1:52-1731(+)